MIQAIPLPRWLLLLILPWFTSAQNSALSPLKLFTLNPFFLCSNVPFWWEGKDADAPFTLYMARGNGPIGNNDSLSAEMFVSYTDDTNASPYLDESYGEFLGTLHQKTPDLSDARYSHSEQGRYCEVPSRGQ